VNKTRPALRPHAVSPTLLAIAGAVLWATMGVSTSFAQDEIAVTNFAGNSVTVYTRTASGNMAPLRQLSGATTRLSQPLGVVQDLVHDELVVANNSGFSVTVYPRTATGNTAPIRTLTGFASAPSQVAVDLIHDELYVVGQSSINVYSRTAIGNAMPLRTLVGPATGLSGASDIALDLIHDELVVANAAGSAITVYARTASGNTPPMRTVQGFMTGLNFTSGVALDLVHDEVVVANKNGNSVTAYPRTASGNVLPVRTLQGVLTGLTFPIGIVLDLVHDELVIPGFINDVAVFARLASGNSPPLRTLSGSATLLNVPEFATLTTNPPLLASVLPLSRSHQFGTLLTAFATIINAGPGPVQDCLIQPPAASPIGLGPIIFQTTDPSTNVAVGTPNTPANIPAGGSQTFVFGFTPGAAIPETSLTLNFLCDTTVPVPWIPGVTDLTLVTDANPVPDTIALMATPSLDGIVHIPSAAGLQVFAIGTANVGATGTITVSADTGGSALPVTLTVCETDPAGACLAAAAPSITVLYAGGTTRSFAFFAQARGAIQFLPGVNRVFARLRDNGNVTRGETSAALCTIPNPGC
jgi:hypothetical protein